MSEHDPIADLKSQISSLTQAHADALAERDTLAQALRVHAKEAAGVLKELDLARNNERRAKLDTDDYLALLREVAAIGPHEPVPALLRHRVLVACGQDSGPARIRVYPQEPIEMPGPVAWAPCALGADK